MNLYYFLINGEQAQQGWNAKCLDVYLHRQKFYPHGVCIFVGLFVSIWWFKYPPPPLKQIYLNYNQKMMISNLWVTVRSTNKPMRKYFIQIMLHGIPRIFGFCCLNIWTSSNIICSLRHLPEPKLFFLYYYIIITKPFTRIYFHYCVNYNVLIVVNYHHQISDSWISDRLYLMMIVEHYQNIVIYKIIKTNSCKMFCYY